MKTKRQNLRLLAYTIFMLCACCTIAPKPIDYGNDGCHYCTMTIVDRQHAAELVTNKGKVFKFDAVECMINAMMEMNSQDVELILCNHYTVPEELIDAKKATFVISEQIPSPMGAFLTAFESREAAVQVLEGNTGQLFEWNELLNHFKP